LADYNLQNNTRKTEHDTIQLHHCTNICGNSESQ